MFSPKLYRILEYDYGEDLDRKYSVQYKSWGIWWDVNKHIVDYYEIVLFNDYEGAAKHIGHIQKYGNGPITRIVDKIKVR